MGGFSAARDECVLAWERFFASEVAHVALDFLCRVLLPHVGGTLHASARMQCALFRLVRQLLSSAQSDAVQQRVFCVLADWLLRAPRLDALVWLQPRAAHALAGSATAPAVSWAELDRLFVHAVAHGVAGGPLTNVLHADGLVDSLFVPAAIALCGGRRTSSTALQRNIRVELLALKQYFVCKEVPLRTCL